MIKLAMVDGELKSFIENFYVKLKEVLKLNNSSATKAVQNKGIINWDETSVKLTRIDWRKAELHLERFKREIKKLGDDKLGKKYEDYRIVELIVQLYNHFMDIPFSGLTLESIIYTYIFILLYEERNSIPDLQTMVLMLFAQKNKDIKLLIKVAYSGKKKDWIIEFEQNAPYLTETQTLFSELIPSTIDDPFIPTLIGLINSFCSFVNQMIITKKSRYDVDYALSSVEEVVKGLLSVTEIMDKERIKYILEFIKFLIPDYEIEYSTNEFMTPSIIAPNIQMNILNKLKEMRIYLDHYTYRKVLRVHVVQKNEYRQLSGDEFIKTIQNIIGNMGIINQRGGAKSMTKAITEFNRGYYKYDINSILNDKRILVEELPDNEYIIKRNPALTGISVQNFEKYVKNALKDIDAFKDFDINTVLSFEQIDDEKFKIKGLLYMIDVINENWVSILNNSPFSIKFPSPIVGTPNSIINEIINNTEPSKFTYNFIEGGLLVNNITNLSSINLEKIIFKTISKNSKFFTKSLKEEDLHTVLKLEINQNGDYILKLAKFKEWFDLFFMPETKEEVLEAHFSKYNQDELLTQSFNAFAKKGFKPDPLIVPKITHSYTSDGKGRINFKAKCNFADSIFQMSTITSQVIATEKLHYKINMCCPIFNISQSNNIITIKPFRLLDVLHTYFKRLINRYNKDFNLLAKRIPRNVVSEFLGRGAFSVNHSIASSIGAGMKKPMESYKKRIDDELANIFIAFDETCSMGSQNVLNYRLLLGLLAYGFYDRFTNLVYGLITNIDQITPSDYDPSILIKLNKKYLERANSINYEIAYSISAAESNLKEILAKINALKRLIAAPTTIDKDRYVLQKRVYEDEYFRAKFYLADKNAMICGMIPDKLERSKTNIHIKYGNTETLYTIQQTKPRRILEFNNILDYLKVITEQQTKAGGTSFSGAYDLVEHPILMKGKGLKYFFILTDAELNDGSGGRALKPLSGVYSVQGGMLGIAYNLKRVASRSDTRFAFFYYKDIRIADDNSKIYKDKTVQHLLNWKGSYARALKDYSIKNLANTGYFNDVDFLNYCLANNLLLENTVKYFMEKIESNPLEYVLTNECSIIPALQPILNEYSAYFLSRNLSRGQKREYQFAAYKINELIYDYWPNCFVMCSNEAFKAASTRIIFKRLSKQKFFIPD